MLRERDSGLIDLYDASGRNCCCTRAQGYIRQSLLQENLRKISRWAFNILTASSLRTHTHSIASPTLGNSIMFVMQRYRATPSCDCVRCHKHCVIPRVAALAHRVNVSGMVFSRHEAVALVGIRATRMLVLTILVGLHYFFTCYSRI